MKLKNSERFDGLIETRWGASINQRTSSTDSDKDCEYYEDKDEPALIVTDIMDTVDENDKLLNQQLAYENILQSKVSIQLGEYMSVVRVKRRDIWPDGAVDG